MRAVIAVGLLLVAVRAEANAAWPANLVSLRYVGGPGGTDTAAGSGLGQGTDGRLVRGWAHALELAYVRGVGPVHLGAALGWARQAATLDETVAGAPSYHDVIVQHQMYGLATLEFHIPFNRTRFCLRIRDRIHPWLGLDFGPGVTVTARSAREALESHTFVRLRGRVGVHMRIAGPLALEVFGHFGGDNATAGLFEPGTIERVATGRFRFVGGLGGGLSTLF